MASTPALDGPVQRLYSIPGRIPDINEKVAGCRFSPRCGHVEAACLTAMPDLVAVGPGHRVRCAPRARLAGAG